ncbi:SusC, outer membrane protein [Aquipluma nitroreducens]|uniref:SusC, outer membrane protein n=1 Tax=Aquipluma nitroreducens TaxID=2010828 RepID=A0A5K7S3K7_9BACT|nr:SusC, outer membrane protein [Aquipluma nitroreducens]
MKDVLKLIEDQSEFSFMYNASKIDVYREIDLNVEKSTVEDILKKIFAGEAVSYRIINRNIIISSNSEVNESAEQQKSVSGKVTDSSGGALPGVSVVVKGTTTGTITDANGNYSISNVPANASLQFSFVGMKTKEIPVDNKTSINVQLEDEAIGIEEVVAIGYGTQKKIDLTGSISSIKSEDLSKTPSSSINQVLKGKAAGVMISQTSGQPGGDFSVRIRGTASLNAGNDPLYVIDGLPIDNSGIMPGPSGSRGVPSRNPLNSISPSDIESIEILKDASSTAIFGSRAANGVIIITTKRGKEGKLKVNYSGSIGIQNVIKTPEVLDGTRYANTVNEISVLRGNGIVYDQNAMNAIPNNGKGTDWYQKVLNNNALTKNNTVTLSGGNSSDLYLISFNAFNQDGIVHSSGIKRYTARVNLTHKKEKFDFDFNLNTSLTLDDFVPFATGNNESAGVLQNAMVFTPMVDVYDNSGQYSKHTTAFMAENPIALMNDYLDDGETNRTLGSFKANYELLKGLKVGVNMGFDRQFARRSQYVPLSIREGKNLNGAAYIHTNERNTYNIEPNINYQTIINDIHKIQIMAGGTYETFINTILGLGSSDFPSQTVTYNNLGSGTTKQITESYKSKNQLLSYYGRAFYSYKDRYLVNVTFRADGSSRFGESNKFGYFPAASIAWKLNEENFIKDLGLFSNLKLRAGYGVTGNQEIGNYSSLQFYQIVTAAIGDVNYKGVSPQGSPGNPNLKWEKTGQLDVGLDIGLFNNRVTSSIDYYKRNTKDLLFSLPLAKENGYSSILSNVGEISNEGIEFELSTVNLSGPLQWETMFNIAYNKNKVVSLNEGFTEQIYNNVFYGGGSNFNLQILRPGESVGAIYGYVFDGIWQSNEATQAAIYGAIPGDPKYRDLNGDKKITVDDQKVIGSPDPKVILGLTNNFKYKNFDLSIFIHGNLGVNKYNGTRFQQLNPNFLGDNWSPEILNRWTPTNPSNTIDSKRTVQPDYVHAANTFYLENASFIRLKNITLGYNLPADRLIRGLSTLRLYCDIQNVFTITGYKGVDPEISSAVDRDPYPLSRNFTFGIELGF